MNRAAFVRAAVIAAAVFYVVTGLPLLFAPQWFFVNVGTYPPFNRHYTGDLGAFLLPMGIALLVAARDPSRHHLLIGCAAFASLLHAFNHAYDDFLPGADVPGGLPQTIPLLVFALVLVAAWRLAYRPQKT